MNRQIFKQKQLINYALEIAINKAKLVLTEEELFNVIKNESFKEKLKMNLVEDVCVDEIEYEELPRIILSSLGYISKKIDTFSLINTLKNKYDNFDNTQSEILTNFIGYLVETINFDQKICFDDFLANVFKNYQIEYFVFAIDVAEAFKDYYFSSTANANSKYGNIRPIKLSDLFVLEKNNSQIGCFFDQRYIDYLYANFEDLNKINWRKFEELSAQFFKNKGYDVMLGKGRKDGGADIIAQKDTEVIIIQCKKWKDKVGVSEIKAFHDDVSYGNYSSGFLVCSNDITRDSKNLIEERKYEIKVIDKNHILQELNKLKSFR